MIETEKNLNCEEHKTSASLMVKNLKILDNYMGTKINLNE